MLSQAACRVRQNRFLESLQEAGLAGALISDPRDIYYFTGLWTEYKVQHLPSLLFLWAGQRSWMGTWKQEGQALVDQRDTYPASLLATMNPDNHRRLARLAEAFAKRHRGRFGPMGFQAESGPKFVVDAFLREAGATAATPIDDLLARLQLIKDADEIAAIRAAQHVNLVAYQRAFEFIEPGRNELEVLAECQKAALAAAGKPVYFGGDFQCGTDGGPARDRVIPEGEFYIIDAQVDLDGYWSDLSRAWVVGGQPTDLQQSVYDHLARILIDVPKMVWPGKRCSEFFRELDERMREHPHLADIGLIHHGGHGIGLRAHEGPDISSEREATFEVGCTFTVEPGAYTPELRGGIRLENNFLLTEAGVDMLSDFPLTPLPYSA